MVNKGNQNLKFPETLAQSSKLLQDRAASRSYTIFLQYDPKDCCYEPGRREPQQFGAPTAQGGILRRGYRFPSALDCHGWL